MKRRSFVGLLACAGAAVGLKLPSVLAPAQGRISMERYSSDAFASRLGQIFSFHRTADANDPPIRLELVEVQSSPHGAMAGGRQPFSLLFALRSGDATQESTLHLRHDGFEPCAWFVNRVTAPEHDRRVPYYEAVFG
jgi:hypothetical protein